MATSESQSENQKVVPVEGATRTRKECLVSIGATAEFRELIKAVLSPEVIKTLAAHGYTKITLQTGLSDAYFRSIMPKDKNGLMAVEGSDMEILGFAMNPGGLHQEMRACQQDEGKQQGMVICHAGAGTVLDAMRLSLPIIVVPNTSLADNHQAELAEELNRQGYATMSSANADRLVQAIKVAESKANKTWPRSNKIGNFAEVVDEVVGYEDDIRAHLD